MIPAERQRHGAAFAILSNFLPTHGTKVLDGSIVTLCELAKSIGQIDCDAFQNGKVLVLEHEPENLQDSAEHFALHHIVTNEAGLSSPSVSRTRSQGSVYQYHLLDNAGSFISESESGQRETTQLYSVIVSIFTKHPRWRNSSKLKKEVVWRRDGNLVYSSNIRSRRRPVTSKTCTRQPKCRLSTTLRVCGRSVRPLDKYHYR